MTKTLTEQWREGTLPEGYYYVLYADQSDHYPSCDTEDYDDIDYWNGCEWHYDNDPVVEVLAPVPSYDEFVQQRDFVKDHLKVLIENMNLKRKLAIATKALEKFKEQERDYLDYGIDKDGNRIYLYPNRVATKALKEMEGVK